MKRTAFFELVCVVHVPELVERTSCMSTHLRALPLAHGGRGYETCVVAGEAGLHRQSERGPVTEDAAKKACRRRMGIQ
jgi:hypothetical protein